MQITPIHTRVLIPPQDDLFEVITESITSLEENSIVVVTSKVVSIHQGRCVAIDNADKQELIRQEAEKYLPIGVIPDRVSPVTIKNHVVIGSAGIDESNGDGYYILLPEKPMQTAEEIRTFIKNTYKVKNVGVLIVDSYSIPMRRGALNISIGFAGITPLVDYRGKKDIFGRDFCASIANVVDGLAASAGVVMGEGNGCTPLAVITELPKSIIFGDTPKMKEDLEFFVPYEKDRFKFLFDQLPWQDGESAIE